MRAIAFVHHFLIVVLILGTSALDRPFNRFLGHVHCLCILQENPEFRVGGRVGGPVFHCQNDVLTNPGKSFGHLVPPLEHPRLSVFKSPSHTYNLLLVIFNVGTLVLSIVPQIYKNGQYQVK
ncbi:hypothetical protein D3C86_1809900 [compost metagenome]